MSRLTGLAALLGPLTAGRAGGGGSQTGTEPTSELAPLPLLVAVPTRPVPFPVSMLLAPMINQCDVPFRRLCAAFGADVVYTQMLLAADVVRDSASNGLRGILGSHFSADGDGAPLVAQIAGDCPATMAAAASALAPHCAAVDINLGCPQDAAQAGHYGGWLCKDRRDWPLVSRIVSSVAATGALCFCKMRLQDSLSATLEFARLLQASGCSLLVVHGRKLGSTKRRRAGPADLEAIAQVRAALSIPVVANGNVRCHADLHANAAATGCTGVMIGEAALRSPAVFSCVLAGCSGSAAASTGCARVAGSGSDAEADGQATHRQLKRPRVEWTDCCGGGAESISSVAPLDPDALVARGVQWLYDSSACSPAPPASSESMPVSSLNVSLYLRLCLGRLAQCASAGRPGIPPETTHPSTDAGACEGLARSSPDYFAALAMLWPPQLPGLSRAPLSSDAPADREPKSDPSCDSRPVHLRHVVQHVGYMLGRTGRGPSVQYAFLGGPFRRPTELRDAIQASCSGGGLDLEPSSGSAGVARDLTAGESDVVAGVPAQPETHAGNPGQCQRQHTESRPQAEYLDEEPGGRPATSVPFAEIAGCLVRLAGVISFVLPAAARPVLIAAPPAEKLPGDALLEIDALPAGRAGPAVPVGM